MQNNDLLRQILEGVITEDTIRQFVYESVCVIVRDEFYDSLLDAIKDEIRAICRAKGENYLRDSVDKLVQSEVIIDDGWGGRQHKGSFEDFVRDEIGKMAKDKWSFSKILRDEVKKRFDGITESVIEEASEAAYSAIGDEILRRIAEQSKENKQ